MMTSLSFSRYFSRPRAQLGAILYDRGDFGASLPFFERARRRGGGGPTRAAAELSLGAALYHMNHARAALPHFESAAAAAVPAARQYHAWLSRAIAEVEAPA